MSKDTNHCSIRNGDLFCYHCGDSHAIVMPIKVSLLTAIMDEFNQRHANCEKKWEEPTIDPENTTIDQRCDFWLKHGERGLSSETLFQFFSKINTMKSGFGSVPQDPDDFKRCYKLLNTFPEWRKELYRACTISNDWKRLIDVWDTLEKMYEDLLSGKKDTGMFGYMKTILNKK